MRCILALAAVAAICAAAPCSARQVGLPGARPGEAVPLRFSDTDAGDVVMAVARAFHANVVMPSQLKKPVNLSMTVRSVDEALTAVAAASGLAWRRIGSTYVIALPADLKQALENRGEKERVPVSALTPAEAVSMVTSALPYLTARPAGSEVLLIGAPEDIDQARQIMAAQEKSRVVEPTASEVIGLVNAPAAQATTVLKDVCPAVKVSSVGPTDKPGGLLSLSGPQSQVAAARELLTRIDVPTAPREPDRVYKVYEIKYSSAPALVEFLTKALPEVTTVPGPAAYGPPVPGFRPITAVSLGASTTGGGTGGGGGGYSGGGQSGASSGSSYGGGGAQEEARKPGDRAKTVVLMGPPAQVDAALAMLADVDIPPKQVMVEVKVVDTSPEKAEELGIKWSWTEFGLFEAPAGTTIDTQADATRRLGFGAFSRVPWSVQGLLTALITDKQTKILANPRMQVTDNDDANIFIGDTLRTQVSQSSISGTTLQVLEFPVGILLLVRPRVNADGRITLRVHPVVSTVTGFSATASGDLPQTSSREAETTVMVKDGETIVIGGLIRDEETKIVTEVPILAKLPIVGELFRNRSTSRRHSEVLVFITPRVVTP